MTVEELKIEAKKLGYKIIKDNPKPKRLACVCGSKRVTTWFRANSNVITFECCSCGRKASGESEQKAIENWNDGVNKEIEQYKSWYNHG